VTTSSHRAMLLDSLTTAVLHVDDTLRVSYMNAAAEDLFGVSARQYTGQALAAMLPHASEMCGRLEQARLSREGCTEREAKLPLGEREPLIVDYTVTPMVAQGAGGLLVEIVALDRHLRISREENLIAQQQASRAVVRGLAHEIKNPLGGLRGAAQLLSRELEDPDLQEYTRIIMGEADRLKQLVNNLLGPNRPPRKQVVNIHQLLDRVRTLVEAEGHDGLVFSSDYDPSLPELVADPDQLIQALLNIVRNAVEAMAEQMQRGEGGRILLRTRAQRQITIAQHRHRLVVRVDIIDNGPGIEPAMLDNIFYPMVTGRAEGTGLGLSIAQDLVNRQGGLVECTSEPGKTCFTLLLPLESAHES